MHFAPQVIALVICTILAAHTHAADWPQWRGPDRSGISTESSGHPAASPPKELWNASVGPGCTSPVIVGGRLYVMGWSGKPDRRNNAKGNDVVYCFDAKTGKEIWKQSYPCLYQSRQRTGDTGQYGGPSATPAVDVDAKRLYTLSVDGNLHCRKLDDGELVWSVDLYDRYRIPQRPNVGKGRRDFGFTASPLLLGDVVIVEVGSEAGTIVAFDKATGKQKWTSELRGSAGHTAGPSLLQVGGKPAIATLTLTHLVVMWADGSRAGRTIASTPWQTDYACNIPTPVVAGNRILLTSEYNHKESKLYELSGSNLRPRWTSRAHAIVATPLIKGDRIYFLSGPAQCVQLRDGEKVWQGGSFGSGCSAIATADDKLIVLGNGRLTLLDAKPTTGEYTELSRVDRVVRGTCYPHLALSDGILACKDRDGRLAVFGLTK